MNALTSSLEEKVDTGSSERVAKKKPSQITYYTKLPPILNFSEYRSWLTANQFNKFYKIVNDKNLEKAKGKNAQTVSIKTECFKTFNILIITSLK